MSPAWFSAPPVVGKWFFGWVKDLTGSPCVIKHYVGSARELLWLCLLSYYLCKIHAKTQTHTHVPVVAYWLVSMAACLIKSCLLLSVSESIFVCISVLVHYGTQGFSYSGVCQRCGSICHGMEVIKWHDNYQLGAINNGINIADTFTMIVVRKRIYL